MKQIVKEIMTPSKVYKAEIMKRSDGLFEYCICTWTREEVPEYAYMSEWYGDPLTKILSLIDTENHAIKLALEDLYLYSGEKLE
ncbi:hypothetical protein [Niallia endozanthoxylica]|uniref:Uncharacterized protein n=1 Tax=Niallia endozanthoxylica TaxID=2036016 RepID=A0A5J5I0X2_9BACI|nr:hypothetical protein [Niallia endozanthoxylica]KAA9029104.1 hypothetical protein F4V44_03305 [Niallia endozanthoxylica]